MSQLVNVTGTANFGAAGLRLGSAWVTGGSAAATATIRNGGSGGTIVAELATGISGMGGMFPADSDNGFVFSGQPHVTIVGAGASFTYEEV